MYICAKNTWYPTRRNFFHLLGFGPFSMQVNFVFALHLRPVQCFLKMAKTAFTVDLFTVLNLT